MQYLLSVIDDGTGLATPDEQAAIELAVEGPTARNRKVEVRPFL